MSSTLWSGAEAAAATGGVATATFAATGVSIDTRSLAAGDLFVAIRDARDGHDFVADAFTRGAAAAMVSADPAGVAATAPLLRVADTLEGLRGLGRAARARSGATVVGVTGSTVVMTATCGLARRASGAISPGWLVPLSITA